MEPQPLSKLIRDALRKAVERDGLNMTASKIGISASAVSRLICGERDIYLKTADKIADALGVTVKTKPTKEKARCKTPPPPRSKNARPPTP